METLFSFRHSPVLILLIGLTLAGCDRGPSGMPAPAPPSVQVSHPVEREVTDYVDFTGRTAAVESVEVRARVVGYLDNIRFKEGALVNKGDVLFEIDPRTYRAMLAQAEGNVGAMEARLRRLDADLRREETLLKQKVHSRAEYDRVAGERGEAAASLQALRAAVGRARLDLSFTSVISPISGRVARALVTVGNLVQSGDQGGGTLLTTVVSVDPMYVYFDVDENTVLRVKRLVQEGKIQDARDAQLPVFLQLANEREYPHRGTIDFIDNQINPRTGTIRVRGVFPNRDEAIAPGLFARVRVPVGTPHRALLVSERAVDTDLDQKILYVVTEKNEVATRPIRLGARHDGLRVVEEGLKPGERVVVVGLQQVRPGAAVSPRLVDMPVSSPQN